MHQSGIKGVASEVAIACTVIAIIISLDKPGDLVDSPQKTIWAEVPPSGSEEL